MVDATKDGGVWWSPQSGGGGFSVNAEHQGKKLANYLRSLGYQVDELPSGGVITWSQLKQYNKVIKAGSYGNYSSQELLAYDSFLSKRSSLMLLNEYLRGDQSDNLSEHLGLRMSGAIDGTIIKFLPHPVTTGVTPVRYIAGSSVSTTIKNDKIIVLGWLDKNDEAVMGILQHPTSKIFFIGDTNGIEEVPQPLVSNLVKWLY